ncbi:methionyl-tRNA formyltransferase [Entomospira culicis]|uniref:Methionyl-tRNA formyltransferase n=1 Tax=Entomospira culicis TaxID=2719989 RepID=A0A968GIE9_9SPIO|nr:methionyl-tRNA formyltransferase [Entomospira culicis]NIZ19463.1 methionyl-tRNA formyltransferase [Entomospira culicis]NIZ69632.1 methionyl-tRNA formyltransferase [Entomospira culicis]WDI36743.1 methionyl-tRNA formyltransferase [Entomospira culicis]WDI38372.1 methionyl-tRNA formyltransferase [Entomospira culicis]
MRILFAGTPEIALPTLERLLTLKGAEVVGVLTNPDAPVGRSKEPQPTPIKRYALQKNIPVYTPQRLDGAFEEQIEALRCDLLVCFAYGKIFKATFLALFAQGGINIHPSLLPKYRGPTPIQAALLAGDSESGITIQRLGLRMDAGDILGVKHVSLSDFPHADAVQAYVAREAAELLSDIFPALVDGSIKARVQEEAQATYCAMLQPSVGKIDFSSESGLAIVHKIRAYTYYPGAFCLWQDKKLFLYQATFTQDISPGTVGEVVAFEKNKGLGIALSDGMLWVTLLKLQGKREMDSASFFHGNRAIIGQILQ